jgi:uncharacterized protein YceK
MRTLTLPLALALLTGCGSARQMPADTTAASTLPTRAAADDDDEEEEDDDEDEIPVDLADLPQPVLDTLDANWPGAELLEAEIDEGIYDVDFLHDGQRLEVEITPDGTLQGVEEEEEEDGD